MTSGDWKRSTAACRRAHRIGQRKPVTVYRLVAQVFDGADVAARLSTHELLKLLEQGSR